MILLKGGKHRIIVKNKTGVAIKQYDLDLCNGPDKFYLNYKTERIRHKIIDYSVDDSGLPSLEQLYKGRFVQFGLDYSDLSNAPLTSMLGEIMDHQAGNNLEYEFYPFLNDLSFHLTVIDDTDELLLRELENEGYEGLYLRFISKDVITKLNWFTQAQLAATYTVRYRWPHKIQQSLGDSDAVSYSSRVTSDGGIVIDPGAVNDAVNYAKSNSFWNNVVFWTEARFGVKKDGGQLIEKWYNLKSNDATQTTGANKPTWIDAVVNGLPVTRYNSTSGYFNLPDFLTSLTEAEVFLIVKLNVDPPVVGTKTGLWVFGSSGNECHYPFIDGNIYDDWGSTVRKTAGNPAPALTDWHLLNISSKAGEYISRINGTQIFTTGTNTVGFTTAPKLGKSVSGYYLNGDIAGMVIINFVSSSIRNLIQTYINNNYNLF